MCTENELFFIVPHKRKRVDQLAARILTVLITNYLKLENNVRPRLILIFILNNTDRVIEANTRSLLSFTFVYKNGLHRIAEPRDGRFIWYFTLSFQEDFRDHVEERYNTVYHQQGTVSDASSSFDDEKIAEVVQQFKDTSTFFL